MRRDGADFEAELRREQCAFDATTPCWTPSLGLPITAASRSGLVRYAVIFEFILKLARDVTETSRGCVLFASMEFYPTNVGGAGTFIHYISRHRRLSDK